MEENNQIRERIKWIITINITFSSWEQQQQKIKST
jgi:hypothetical protein